MTYVMGCDLGSQSAKVVLVGADGVTVAADSTPYQMSHPRSGWAEQDPGDYQRALARSARAVLAAAGVAPDQVSHLGLSSQVDGVVAVDADNRALHPAIIWLDRRAVDQVAALESAVGADHLFARTGLNLDASHTAPKYMWLRDERPEVYRAAASLPSVGGYAVGWLTGRVIQDHANSSSTLLYDVHRRMWSEELVEAAGLDAEKLPQLGEATEVAGPLSAEAADALGLTTRCLVVVGTGDDHASCLGAGGVRPGVVIDIVGTAEPVAVASDVAVLDPDRLVETHAHATPGGYLIENPGFVSGGNTTWFSRNVLGVSQQEFFDLAEQSVPGAHGVRFLPALSGSMAPRWNDNVRGSFAGLAMNHTRADMARAILEGNAFAFRDIYDRLVALGLGGSIRSVGGGSRSRLWLSAKATLCRTPIALVTNPEPSAAGGALLAAVAAGHFSDLAAAVEATVTVRDTQIDPDPGAEDAYDEAYAQYRELFDATEQLAG